MFKRKEGNKVSLKVKISCQKMIKLNVWPRLSWTKGLWSTQPEWTIKGRPNVPVLDQLNLTLHRGKEHVLKYQISQYVKWHHN